ncbi:MAG TPA: hypothetical protein VJ124_11115 [Pyrinomonadaceae bacterium]|nr:hypothetical protein [Pyrinomonadaceae bacterium]
MKRFLERHSNRITGTLSGFDRVLFRGTLRSIVHVKGLEIFLYSQHVLFKDFGRYAEGLSQRIIEQAKSTASKLGRPYQYLWSSKASKEELALEIMERDGIKQGLIAVFACVEPCQSFDLRKDAATKHLKLISTERKCLHLYFYYLDREFGLMHVRLQTWLPFSIQVCLNGREWLAKQMDRAGITYTQRDNCFTHISDAPRAQKLMDRLTARNWRPFLDALAQKVNPWIHPRTGLDLHGYYWSVRQMEYATDVMFCSSASLAELYPLLLRHAMFQFGSEEVMRFLQRRTDKRFSGEVSSDLQRRVEGIRVKHRVEENSIKMYDKQGSVLRIETTINNPKRFKVRREGRRAGKLVMRWMDLRRGIADCRRRAELSAAANARYLDALAVVGLEIPSYRLLDRVSRQIRGKRHYRALRPISPEDASLFQLILHGEHSLQGFRNRDLRQALEPSNQKSSSARISRLLALLRAHKLIYKVFKTNYYRITRKGHQVMATALKFRQPDLALLAA